MKKRKWKKFLSGILAAMLLTGSLCDYTVSAVESGKMEVLRGIVENEELLATENADIQTAGAEAQDLQTAGAEAQDLQTAGAEAQDPQAASAEAQDPQAAEVEAQDLQATETEAQDTRVADAEAQDLQATEAEAQDLQAAETEAQDTRVADAEAQDLQATEAEAQDLQAADAEAQDTQAAGAEAQDTQAAGAEAQDTQAAQPAFQEGHSAVAALEESVGTTDVSSELSESTEVDLPSLDRMELKSVTSTTQGYNEIVLDFRCAKNASDGTITSNAYYEVRVIAAPQAGQTVPAGSPLEPIYYYIPKTEGVSRQSKAIRVNDGELTGTTACTYEISVRLVLINRELGMPDQNKAVDVPMLTDLVGNTITKQYTTKDLYYEKKLGFSKKGGKLYTGQSNVYVGKVKYSETTSYLHDLTAVAYDSVNGVCEGITCTFRGDDDQLYLSAESTVKPGTYKITVYAGVGEAVTKDVPQSGTMYQANTTFNVTVMPAIYTINTEDVLRQAAVNNQNISFSAKPVGYGYYNKDQKAKTQKFTYTIMSAYPVETDETEDAEDADSSEDSETSEEEEDITPKFIVTDPVDKVKNNVSVTSGGKVTIKRGYYVDPDTTKNYIAIVIKAADYPENTATAVTYVQVVANVLVPTEIYLTDANGNKLGTTLSAAQAHEANVVVLDQNGNNMNEYVLITPTDNAGKTANVYVEQANDGSGAAKLYVRKPTTVSIRAKTKDGNQKSKTVKFKITVPTFSDGYYTVDSITSNGFSVGEFSAGAGVVTYSAPQGVEIRYQQGAKINGTGCYHWNWFDWRYSIKGGKVKRDGEYLIVSPTTKTAEVTMWLKSNSSQTWSVKFTNSTWDKVYEDPPSVKKVSGQLYSTKYSNASEVTVDEEGNWVIPPQTIQYHYDFGSYDEIQFIKGNTKCPDLTVQNFDPANRLITLTNSDDYIKPGTYPYKIAFFRDGVMMNRPATINVKVEKAVAIKLQQNYKLNINSQSYITLSCTTKNFMPDFQTDLLNANVNGVSNNFSDYFQLAVVEDYNAGGQKVIVRLRSGLPERRKALLVGQTLTGYVKYSYYNGSSYVRDATCKIRIKVVEE